MSDPTTLCGLTTTLLWPDTRKYQLLLYKLETIQVGSALVSRAPLRAPRKSGESTWSLVPGACCAKDFAMGSTE
jgi:hypothetical protein